MSLSSSLKSQGHTGLLNFQYGLADFYLKRGMFEQARPIVQDMVSMHPENPIGGQMLNFIRNNTGK
jgi:hypothetical protein